MLSHQDVEEVRVVNVEDELAVRQLDVVVRQELFAQRVGH